MTKNLTPWFPGRLNPAREGVYQVLDGSLKLYFYCYWDGRGWYYGASEWSLSDASYTGWKVAPWKDSASELKRWRGLSEQRK